MRYRILGNTGLRLSILGFGASPLGGGFGPIDDAEAIRAVRTAFDLGINFVDVAPFYGATRAETVLGRALRGIPRDRYILSTKVGQYGEGEFDFSAARVARSFDESCQRLGVERIDLLICHDIEFVDLNQIVDETLPALVKLRQAGRIGHIGLSGLPLKIFPAVLDRIAPDVVGAILSYCRYGLIDDRLAALLPYLLKKKVGVINAAPTAMGLLTGRGVPFWHPAPADVRAVAFRAVEYCQSVGADVVKLALQFCVANPSLATTLIGVFDSKDVRRNILSIDEPIDLELLAKVREILRPIHNHNWTRGRPENRDPELG